VRSHSSHLCFHFAVFTDSASEKANLYISTPVNSDFALVGWCYTTKCCQRLTLSQVDLVHVHGMLGRRAKEVEVRVPQRAQQRRARNERESVEFETPEHAGKKQAEAVPAVVSGPSERRKAARLAAVSRESNSLITSDWAWMAPVLLLGFALVSLSDMSLPSQVPTGFSFIAAIVVGLSKLISRFELARTNDVFRKYAVMLAFVALPMGLFGASAAMSAKAQAHPHWPLFIAILVAVGFAASMINAKRLPTAISALVALWSGVSVVAGSLSAVLILLLAAACGFYLAMRHERNEAIAAELYQEMVRKQHRAEELLAEYEESGQGWFWESDRRGLLSYVSPTIGELLQQDVKALLGRPFTQLFIIDSDNREGERTLNFHLSARSSFQELPVRAATPGEEERWWSISGRPVHDEYNNFMGFRGSGSDLTEKRKSQESATRLAHYDSLTSLANRFQMAQLLEKILNAQRLDHRACSVFLLDLDRFKQVNDTMGHPAGDALLTQVAQRLERIVDKAGRVGRLGGDEFQIIVPGQQRRDQLANLAKRIIETVSQPYSIDGHSVTIGVSVGIALSPDDGVTSEALIRNADLALYAAKDGGRGRHHFYAADLHSDAEERRQLESDLRDALVNGGLELYYQPVVHTTTEKITGFEALLRWTHPKLGPLSPAKFIPIAEETGLIAPIGEWALRTACMAMAKWPDSVRVAVNVSPLQFSNPSLPSIVTSACAAAQVDPTRLELEITESVFLNDDSGNDAMFAALKRIGVRLALDDFGTGYSSLGYLKKAPFDKIKIDQSFVRGATMKGSRNGAIIASIVSLAEALGMETTAEGVETLDELDLIRMLGCSHIQGYIYEKPLNAKSATARLESGLIAIAHGPRAARQRRQTMLRKVVLDCAGERYPGTIRNISSNGALVEGLWNVPPGTVFTIHLDATQAVVAVARWSQDDRVGMEFATPLSLDESGKFVSTQQNQIRAPGEGLLKKSG
jgi:diguanylate cyclase (GGDEF)-like protein